MPNFTQFLNAIFWEYVQNLPVIVMFVMAVWFWAQERRSAALACMAVGAVGGALTIRFTEPLTSGHHETWTVTFVNIVLLCLVQVPATVYLSEERRWSNWRTDLALGGLTGVGIAMAQWLAAQSGPLIGVLLHSFSLAATGSFVMLGTRESKDKPLATVLGIALMMTLVMTLLISAVDYGYLLLLE